MNLQIIFEDEYLMVINKPPGLVVTPADSVKAQTLSDILLNSYKIKADRGGIVHRLDKDTSGVILVAKSDEMVIALQSQFKERTVHKTYLALAHGFTPNLGHIEGDVGRNPFNREKFTVIDNGKSAETDYVLTEHLVFKPELVEEIFAGFNKIQQRKMQNMNYFQFSLVQAFPKTGRTHQIRVHFKHINYPLVSDEIYGGRKVVRLDQRWCPRQFLHAQKIEFNHPVTGKHLVIEAPLPEDLAKALACLRPSK